MAAKKCSFFNNHNYYLFFGIYKIRYYITVFYCFCVSILQWYSTKKPILTCGGFGTIFDTICTDKLSESTGTDSLTKAREPKYGGKKEPLLCIWCGYLQLVKRIKRKDKKRKLAATAGCRILPKYFVLCRIIPDCAVLCRIMPYYTRLCYIVPSFAVLCYIMLYSVSSSLFHLFCFLPLCSNVCQNVL